MKLEALCKNFSVCKTSHEEIPAEGFCFFARTDGEISLVCESEFVPDCAYAREDGWRAFRVSGELDFSLVGILASITSALAQKEIPVFAVSTYNTDYILVRSEYFTSAADTLSENGYNVEICTK